MRDVADLTRIQRFMRALGERARDSGRVYLTGGATAVLYGWRPSTIDVDVKFAIDEASFRRRVRDIVEGTDTGGA